MIFFDSAATSFQKPPEVRHSVLRAMEQCSSPGRGAYAAATAAAETVYDCRCEAAKLFHVENEENIVFASNATHALNLAIFSLVEPGDEVLISGYEHNAVIRPLRAANARVRVLRSPLFSPEATLSLFRPALSERTKAVVWTHVSNVFGAVQPIAEIAALCREKGVPLIIDASQSAGILPLDASALGAAFIAMPGHKGLYGPQGTGLLLISENTVTKPLLHGGTGILSREKQMPETLPERLEAGTLPVAAIAGLAAGIRFVRKTGEKLFLHERTLLAQTAEEMQTMRRIRPFYAPETGRQTGVLSFTVAGEASEDVAAYLAEQGIAVRAGLHCAPTAHETAGTAETGTVRVSFSAFNTRRECVNFLKILAKKYG